MRELLPGILLLHAAYTDIKKREVSGLALIVFGVLGCVCALISKKLSLSNALMGAALGLIMVSISIISRGEFGMGDGLIMCVTGLFLGFEKNVLLILGGVFFAAVFSVGLLTFKRNLKQEFPFIPFLFLAYSLLSIKGGFT